MGLLDSERRMIDHKNRGVRLKIVVSDSGVGMTLSVSGTFSSRIRRPFRLPYTRGTGLGLSIISSLLKILEEVSKSSPRLGKEPSSLSLCLYKCL
jgi:signal transduction histidine kinase